MTSAGRTLPLTAVALVLAVLTAGTVTPRAQAGAPAGDVVVGAFRLHVQIEQRRVEVIPARGALAAALPSTSLAPTFTSFDRATRTVSIDMAMTNTGAANLYGGVRMLVTGLASPQTLVSNADNGSGIGSWTWLFGSAGSVLVPGGTRARRLEFVSPTATAFQVDVRLVAGIPLPAGAAGVVTGDDGSQVRVAEGAVPYELFIDVEKVPEQAIAAPLGNLPFVGAVNVTFQSNVMGTSLVSPLAPLEVAIPAPADLPSSRFVVCQQILTDSLEGTPGLKEQLVPVDTASVSGGMIVTDSDLLPGIFGGGVFVFVANTGSGFATGIVTDASGPRAGAVVSNDTNTLVSITNGAGSYTLFINGGPFSVTAFDPFRGSGGSASSAIAVSGSTVTANIPVTPLAAPPVTRDGIRNNGFERGDLSSWGIAGGAAARQQLVSSLATIAPTEGAWMADIHTGGGSIGGVGSSLKQDFIVPAGVRTLTLDFNFVSEEFPEFVNSVYDDSFRALITTPNGQSTMAQVSVNQHGGFQLIGDCGFPGGDSTCGQTGWRTGSVDLSAFSGTGTPVTVELLFSTNDAGDNIYDTHVLVDNVRFSTVWVDAKVIAGAAASLARIQQEVRDANEVLSQAGINVQLRGRTAIADPGALLDADATWTTECRPALLCLIGLGTTKGVPTAEETQLLALGRSGTATDVNVYYARSITGLGALAIAVGPDDFHDIDILTNGGIITTDSVWPETLGHELGHLLISPQRAGDALEHGVGVATNLMNTPRTVPRNVVSRQQSESINRTGAPLLRP